MRIPVERLAILLVLLAVAAPAAATIRTWPGAAPCDGSLQACIDASAAADTVLVASSGPISPTLFVNKPLQLLAAPGYRPRIAAGAVISGTVNAAGNWTWEVSGFQLDQGFISLFVQGGTSARVVMRDNRILAPIGDAAQISLFKPSAVTTTLDYDLSANVLSYAADTFDGALHAAIQVLDGGSGSSEGRISENRITALGSQAIGILVSTIDRVHRVAVQGNQVRGGRDGAIYLRQGSLVGPGAGSLQALVSNNVVRSAAVGARGSDGIVLFGFDGTLVFDALHNTVVDAWRGVDVFASDGVDLAGSVRGNLFGWLDDRGINRPASGVSDSRNLFFQTGDLPAQLNADSIFADPRLKRGPADPHLAPDSPAIDASTVPLTTVMASYGLDLLDGDGLRRVKRANGSVAPLSLDIGALEAGDETLLHQVAQVAPGNVSDLDEAALNGFAAAAPQVGANWNPDGGVGIYNNHAVSAQYVTGTGRWRLRQEDLAPFSAGARFNLFAPGAGGGRFVHQNTASNTSGPFTELDDSSINNRDDAILLVTRNPGSSGTVVDLPVPVALVYFSGVWSVYASDGGTMPASGGFNVYAQPPSVNAFRHRAVAANTAFNYTRLDHPLLNGSRCARFHVTQSTNLGVVNAHNIGVYYIGGSTGRWAIFNQDGASMPAGAEFHVVVDPQSVDCPVGIFADGFESP